MHTTTIRSKKYGEIVIHHNADWSGSLTIGWDENVCTYRGATVRRVAVIPASVLLLVQGAFFRDHTERLRAEQRDEFERMLEASLSETRAILEADGETQ